MADSAELGMAIRRLRLRRRESIEVLARRAGIHPTHLSKVERGGTNPTWDVVDSLAKALEVSVARLASASEVEALRARLYRLADVEAERAQLELDEEL